MSAKDTLRSLAAGGYENFMQAMVESPDLWQWVSTALADFGPLETVEFCDVSEEAVHARHLEQMRGRDGLTRIQRGPTS